MSDLRCWQCGARPDEVFEVTSLADPEPQYLPGRWPDGDHEHAVHPPTPGELEAAGSAALARIVALA